jgi:hypothetical protein
MEKQVRVTSGLNVLLGLWLIASPWLFDYASASEGSVWSSLIVGVLIAFFGSLRWRFPHEHAGRSLLNIVLGAWTFFSTWVFGYGQNDSRIANSLIVGLLIMALASWSSSATLAQARLARERHGPGR